MNELISHIKTISAQFDLEPAAIAAFIAVETGGRAYGPGGKIIIQFEPVWFRRKQPYAPSGKWSVNKVDVQSKEWDAFNEAFAIDKESAMESTSIGLGQIMGFHWSRLGYKSVGDMWDDAKKGIDRQIWQICKFISTDLKLKYALKAKAWGTVADIYNGRGYKQLAYKIGREPYDISMAKAYQQYKAI